MTDLEISLARPSDLPDILSMIRALASFHGDTATITHEALQEALWGDTATVTALVAKSDGAAVGYAGITWDIILHEGARRADIHHLYVKEAHRARGVGAALIARARDHAKETGAVRLTIGTDPDNATAIAAYRAMDALVENTNPGPRFAVRLDVDQ